MLRGWVRHRKTAQALAVRSRIVLACAQGGTITAVATELGVSRDMVSKWRRRFAEHRLEGLVDEPRPGRPRTVGGDQVEQVVVKTLESAPPKGDTHWSTRSMAKATGMSQTTVSRIWRAFGLKPHQMETWKLSTDPQFIDKVRDIVGLYLEPPERALVLCVDEKSQMQAIDRTAPILPVPATTPARMSHGYVRHGTTSLFAALELSSGAVIAEHHRRHRHQEFLRFLKTIDKAARRSWTCTWSATTTPPTRLRPCTSGSCATHASTRTSPRPARPGLTSSSDGSPSSPTVNSAAPHTAVS